VAAKVKDLTLLTPIALSAACNSALAAACAGFGPAFCAIAGPISTADVTNTVPSWIFIPFLPQLVPGGLPLDRPMLRAAKLILGHAGDDPACRQNYPTRPWP